MILAGEDFSDDDLVKISVELLVVFYFCSGQSHRIRVLFSCHIEIRNISFDP